jgi:hypothetical protein
MKLWLDDERDPKDPHIQKEFNSTPDMVWVKTVPEAITLLETGEVIEISLDHDLGLPQTGYDLARWIEEKAFNKQLAPLKWRLHTQNTVGRKFMRYSLRNADKYWSKDLTTSRFSQHPSTGHFTTPGETHESELQTSR